MASTRKRKKNPAIVANDNRHIYYGLGTLSVLLLGAFLIFRKSKTKVGNDVVESRDIDLSIFDSPDSPGSGSCIDGRLLSMLRQLESNTGYPIFSWINSGVRSDYWNRKVGGVSNSSHRIPKCEAVDIKALNKTIRNELVRAAHQVGFKRIGVGKTFVHLDVDASKSQDVAWGYPSGTRPEINPFV